MYMHTHTWPGIPGNPPGIPGNPPAGPMRGGPAGPSSVSRCTRPIDMTTSYCEALMRLPNVG